MYNKNTTDDELWEAVKTESIPAFELLYERYWQSVYTTAFSYLHDSDSAAQVANDIFLNIWQKKLNLNINSFKSYLTASARYYVYKVLKTKKVLKLAYVEDYEKLSSIQPVDNTGEEKIHYLDFENNIEHILLNLPQRCREIFIMSKLENLTNTEIADKFSISKRTVENQLSIAQKYLRSKLKDMAIVILLACITR